MPDPLSRLYAFPVSPQRPPTVGGPVPVAADVEEAIDSAYRGAGLDVGRPVMLLTDNATGVSEVRDALAALAFGSDGEADTAAQLLADRLTSAMDNRSGSGLLAISVHGNGTTREVEMWIFPNDTAFRYDLENDTIGLADNVFSISSHVRKAATFRGGDTASAFHTGRVVDFQASGARYVASFWLHRFLGARLDLAGDRGTLVFGKAVKQAFGRLRGDPEAQAELAAALDINDQRRMSIGSFAEERLGESAAAALVAAAPSPETAEAEFDFHPGVFAQPVGYLVFRLDTGVLISAPLDEVGRSVKLTDEVVETRGTVTGRTVRSRA